MRGLSAARVAVMTAVAAIDADIRRMTRASAACRRLMADCDFNRAALHPAYPIKRRTSAQRTQASPERRHPEESPALDPLENNIRANATPISVRSRREADHGSGLGLLSSLDSFQTCALSRAT
jgi:hypothetical protein